MAIELPDTPVPGYNYAGGNYISALTAAEPQEVNMPPDYWHGEDNASPGALQADDYNLDPARDRAAGIQRAAQINQEEGAKFTPFAQGFDPTSPVEDNPPGSQGGPQAADFGSRLQRVGEGQTIAEDAPHPLLSDPRFATIFHSDTTPNKTASRALYSRLANRDLQSDLKLLAAQNETQTKKGESAVTDLVEKQGLTFNNVTGEARVQVKNPQDYQSGDVAKGTASLEEVNPTQFAMLQKFYKPTYGLDVPKGIDVPRGLSPEEATQYRQKVFDLANQDQSKASWTEKVNNAKNKAYREGWNAQQQAAAVAANPATQSSTPGFINRNVTRGTNLQISAYNAIRNPVMNFAARTFGDSPFLRGAASIFPRIQPTGTQDTAAVAASLTSGPQSLVDAYANLPP